MNPRAETLLQCVLREVLPPDREACLLATTLREVARQRHRRALCSRAAAVAALALAVTLTALQKSRPSGTSPAPPAHPGALAASATHVLPVIASQPLASSLIVQTRPGLTPLVQSAAGSTACVETADAGSQATNLTDDELLALLAGTPAALVRIGGETRLVLAALDDRTGSHAVYP